MRLRCKSRKSVQEMKLEAYEVWMIFTFQFVGAVFLEASWMMEFRICVAGASTNPWEHSGEQSKGWDKGG